MSINLVSFADNIYIRSIQRIEREAKAINVFKNIFCWSENDLDVSFREKHKNKLISRSKGYGHWIWKPQIILQALNKLEFNDFLLYVDAGCKINIEGRERLLQYIEMAKNDISGICIFDTIPMPEYMWCKADLYTFLDYTKLEQLSTNQLGATAFILKKSIKTVNLVKKWLYVCEFDNYRLVDDSPSFIPNHSEFKDHRHDQSIFSILCKKNGCVSLPDETYFPEEWHNNTKYPIHALRLRYRDLIHQ